jgi:hypothetical protein
MTWSSRWRPSTRTSGEEQCSSSGLVRRLLLESGAAHLAPKHYNIHGNNGLQVGDDLVLMSSSQDLDIKELFSNVSSSTIHRLVERWVVG